MIKQFKYCQITWLDLDNPTQEEVERVAKEYAIHPVVTHEITSPSLRSKVDLYDDFIYLIMHFPNGGQPNTGSYEDIEVDFILGKNFLITAHYHQVQALEDFAKIFDQGSGLSRKKVKFHAGHLFYQIIVQLYQSFGIGLDYLNDGLRRVEQNIFAGQENEMVRVLSDFHHRLVDFRWTLKHHREILSSFDWLSREFFGDDYLYYSRSLLGEYDKIWAMLENNHEIFLELRQTNESLLSIKTNETMKVLTVLTFIFLPLNLIASIFGMSRSDLPIISWAGGFWWISFLMLLTLVVVYWLVKKKKWL